MAEKIKRKMAPKRPLKPIHPKKEAFLRAVSKTGNISQAALSVDVPRDAHYKWLQDDPKYPERFKSALEESVNVLEAAAWKRAVQGVEKEIYYNGQNIGMTRNYSDVLLIFLLKAANPAKYRDNYYLHHTADKNFNSVQNNVLIQILKDEKGRELLSEIDKYYDVDALVSGNDGKDNDHGEMEKPSSPGISE